MTVARDDVRSVKTLQRMTLKEFLTYDDGTDTRYELVEGVLVDEFRNWQAQWRYSSSHKTI